MTHRFIGAFFAVSLLLVISATSVLAHAELLESDPADGETIETPYTLTATYSEELLDGSNLVVDNATEEEVARGEVDPDDRTIMVVELLALPPVEYVARSTATTADGHTERVTFSFTVAAHATPSPTATPKPTPTVSPAAQPATTPTPAPTATPSPTASPSPSDGPTTAGSNDVVLALVLAGVVIAAIALFLLARSRR
ncbi:MAG: copper resistance CopC family protein [Candidatus Limnocylindrales bacterium]